MGSLAKPRYSASLNFNPVQSWPSQLPTMTWGPWLLTHFGQASLPITDLSEGPCEFAEIFAAIYPKLSLPELARMYSLWPRELTSQGRFSWPDLFARYNLRHSDLLIRTLEVLNQTPLAFQKWSSDRQLSVRDFAPLLSIEQPNDIEPLLIKISELQPSKSVGTRCLELIVELVLSGVPTASIEPQSASAESWYKQLSALRYPTTTAQDGDKSLFMKQLPWPTRTQANWQRRGDESGIEVRFFVKSAAEFEQKIYGLKKVKSKIDSEKKQLWS